MDALETIDTTTAAEQLAVKLKTEAPEHRFAYASDGSSVAYWCDARQRWVDVAGRVLSGGWQGGLGDILVNGKPLNHRKTFVEVFIAAAEGG